MVVLDTSVTFKWFEEGEKGHIEATKILEQHNLGKEKIIAPDLLLYEMTNAWSTKSYYTVSQVIRNLKLLDKWKLGFIKLEITDFKKATEYSKKYKISVYDASYIALARKKKCDFITADQKLVEKVNLPFVKTLSYF